MEKKSNAPKHKLPVEQAEEIRRNPPRNMNVLEGAAYLGVCSRKLRDLIAERKVKHVRLGGKVILRLKDLDEALERQVAA